MDKITDFKIFPYRDHHVIVNTKGTARHHTHIVRRETCEMLIRLICSKIVPRSRYLRSSASRVARDKKYLAKIENRNNREANRQRYYNVQKGARRG